jgi:hypothetical protein
MAKNGAGLVPRTAQPTNGRTANLDLHRLQVSLGPNSFGMIDHEDAPNRCPMCGHGIDARLIASVFSGNLKSGRLQRVFQCPIRSCERLFVAIYQSRSRIVDGKPSLYYKLVAVLPESRPVQEFGELISEISPGFVSIYHQALAAEAMGMADICGPGYRKALEFLVKDFLIRRNPEREAAYRSTALANCIEHHIGDDRIKAMAARAVDLGNDQTHYYRRWQNRDVGDLRALIWLTTRWMEIVLGSERYEQAMPR